MKRYFRVVGAILWKDLAAELRSRETFSAMVVFSLLMVLVFSIALELNRGARESTAAGVLWATALFSGTLGLNRGLGLKDMYPFVLAQPAVEKLRFVHRVCTESAPPQAATPVVKQQPLAPAADIPESSPSLTPTSQAKPLTTAS